MSDATARPPRADATRRWPDDPAAFGDTTRCPSCFSPLTAVVCGVCGLDLRAPAAAEVLASGRRLLAEETHRRELIDGMFRAQRALAARGADASAAAGAPREADASAAAAKAPAAVATGLSLASPRADTAEHAPPSGAPVPLAPPAGAPVPLAPPTGTPVALAAPTGPALPTAPTGPALPTTASAGPPPWAPAHRAEAASGGRRRSGVQVFLLTLGVVLISVTAIVFLFVAYLVASLEVRSVIIAFASALVLGAAVLLRRRRLPGTAEGVAAVAVVLLLLDVWTVRANELFGTAELRPAAYSGIALIVVAGVAAGVRALSGIRTLGATAAVLAPIALFLLGVGIPEDDPTTAIWLGGLFGLAGAIAAAALRLPTVERVIALASGMAGGVIAWWAAAFALGSVAWHPLVTFATVAVAWAALLAALGTTGRALGAGWRWVAAIATGGALAAAPAVAVALELDVAIAAWLAPASAAIVAVLVSLVLRGNRAAAADSTLTPGDRATSRRRLIGHGLLVGAAVVAMLAAIPAGLAGALHVGTLLFDAIGGWNAGTVELTQLAPATVVVPLVFAGAASLIALVLGRVRALAWIPLALTVLGLVMLAVSFGDGVVSVVVLLALGALCLAAAVTVRTPLRGVVPVLAVLGPASAALAWAAGFGAIDAWIWSTLGVLALTVAGWRLVPRRWPASAGATAPLHAGVAAVQIIVVSIAIAPWLVESGVRLTTDWRSPAIWAALICAVAFAAILALRASRATVLAAAAPLLAVASGAVVILLVAGDSPVRWLPALALAAGSAAWAWRGRDTGLAAASAAIAPVALTFAAAWFLGDVLKLAAQADAVAAGALLAAAALAHLLTRRSAAVRLAWVASTGVLTVIIATIALLGGDWLPLALLTPVPVVLAALWGDPITSSAPMRHLAWASGALAIAAWWTWLVDDGATVVELFTLPVAALCLALGALVVARRPLRDRSLAAEPVGEFSVPPPVGEPTPGATPALMRVGEPSTGGDSPRPSATMGRVTLLAAGLAVAVLPSVLAAGDSAARTIVLVAAGSVTLLATAFAPDRVRDVPVGLLGALTGATAAVGGAVVHATAIAVDHGGSTLDWWALAGLVTGIVASIWWARAERRPARLAEWLLTASALAASIPMIVAIIEGEAVELRTLALLPVLAVLHVGAAANAARPFGGPIVRWGSATALVVGAFVSLAAGVDPFDLAVVPVALALIGAGISDLRRRPTFGSWGALGPGLAVLLLPPLLADFTDPQLWRVVALGIVALATLLAGIRWRLQAPFVLGGTVLLVHAIAQLWPWITLLYEAVWWWLWLGLAGVLLVVIAATYERQLRLARTTIGRIAALR